MASFIGPGTAHGVPGFSRLGGTANRLKPGLYTPCPHCSVKHGRVRSRRVGALRYENAPAIPGEFGCVFRHALTGSFFSTLLFSSVTYLGRPFSIGYLISPSMSGRAYSTNF